jgi:hypothetical protein
MADQSLKSLFASGNQRRQEIENSYDRNTDTYHDLVALTIKEFTQARDLADRVGLFSPNETVEDISTGDLPYLQIDFFLAELYQKVNTDRRAQLEHARRSYERFINRLNDYEILSEGEKKQWNEYQETPSTYSTISTSNFEARRAAKIANFKREKELKAKIEFLQQNPLYLQQDDDAMRNLHLAHLAFNTHNTFQALESLNLELQVLASKPPSPPPGPEQLERDYRERTGQRQRGPDGTERLDRPLAEILAANNRPGPILSKDGKPLKVFTLTGSNTRKEIKKGVFRPGHNLPTMSIDEYLEEERARGGIIEGGGEASGIIAEIDEDDHEAMDAATIKARAWDEFVEANPRGSGNTLNRG